MDHGDDRIARIESGDFGAHGDDGAGGFAAELLWHRQGAAPGQSHSG